MTWADANERLCRIIDFHQEIADEGVDPPTEMAYKSAMRQAVLLESKNFPGPKWVTPCGNGGIVFEWKIDSEYKRLQIKKSGEVLEFGLFDKI